MKKKKRSFCCMLMRFNNGTLYQMRRVGGHRQRERQCSHPAQIQVKVKQPELVSTRYYSTSQRTSTRLSSLKTISAKPSTRTHPTSRSCIPTSHSLVGHWSAITLLLYKVQHRKWMKLDIIEMLSFVLELKGSRVWVWVASYESFERTLLAALFRAERGALSKPNLCIRCSLVQEWRTS